MLECDRGIAYRNSILNKCVYICMHLVASRIDSAATSPRSIRLSRQQLRATQWYFRLRKRKNQRHETWLHSILHVFLYLFILSHLLCQKIYRNLITHTVTQVSTLTPVPSLARHFRLIFYLLQGKFLAAHHINLYNYCYSAKTLPPSFA